MKLKPSLTACRRGSATVETMIAFVFMVFLTFAVVQFCLILNAKGTVQYIAREAGRYADANYSTVGFGSTNVQTYVDNVIAPSWSTVPGADTTITYYAPGTKLDNNVSPPPDTMTIEITYNMTHKYLFSGFIPIPKTWTSYTYYYTTFEEGS